MKPERWQQIDWLLQSVLERESDERGAFLDAACAGDEELRREVEALLAAHKQAGKFLSAPAFEAAAQMIVEDRAAYGALTIKGSPVNEQPNFAPTLIAASAQSLPLAPGVILDDRYLIERELGRGGIGVVFLARDQKLPGTQVVIKVLLEHLLKRADRLWFEQKFRDEIAALARIDHPGVVRALDVGQLPDSRSYLVMQYVAGKPLREFIRPEGMKLKRAAGLLHQTAQALAAAHNQRIIHRDLKPENILLQKIDGEEQVKLIDFGIATLRDALTAASPHTTRVAGTPEYMAPEQLRGKPDAVSDIYALGVIAYEMATGRLPFNAASLIQFAELQRAGVEIKPRDLRPDLPEAAQEVILKALAFNPSDRYASARDFSEAFSQAIAAESGEQRPDLLKTASVAPLLEDRLSQPDPFQTMPVASLPENKSSQPGSFQAAPMPQTAHQPSARVRLWIPLAVLLAVMLTGTLAWRSLRSGNPDAPVVTPPNPTTTPRAAPERALSYSLRVKKPGARSFAALDDVVLKAGDEADFNLGSPQTGYLYVINEGPAPTRGLPSFVMLFPRPYTNNRSAAVAANQVIRIPLVFDNEVGVEKYWLIWSERSVLDLEAIKHRVNTRELGAISNPNEINSVAQYLAAHSTTAPEIEKDEAAKQIRFKRRADVLVGLVQLRHQ